jgi:hypothetical protein
MKPHDVYGRLLGKIQLRNNMFYMFEITHENKTYIHSLFYRDLESSSTDISVNTIQVKNCSTAYQILSIWFIRHLHQTQIHQYETA